MKNKVEISIKTDAIGKGRPKFALVGGHAVAYTPKKTKEQEEFIRHEFIKHAGTDHADYEGTVRIFIDVGYQISKSKSKKEQEFMRKNYWNVKKKPDLDNVIKLILDALNGVAFKDDSQIISIDATKSWMDDPITFIRLTYND